MSSPTDSSPPNAAAMRLALRLGIAAYCLGTGLAAMRYEPAVFSFMFTGLDWSSDTTEAVVIGVTWTMIALVPLMFWRRATPLCGLISFWVMVEISTLLYSRERFFALAPLTMSLRLLAPVALILTWRNHQKAATWCLRLGLSGTFFGHGIEAVEANPIFVDYLLAATTRFGLDASEAAATEALLVIGVLDMLSAGLILLRPSRLALYYMTIWGLMTALARVVHSGWEGSTDCVLRLIHCTGPLAVLLDLRSSRPASPHRDSK